VKHPLHRARSLDYAIILSGEIDMMLDEGDVHLKAGDHGVAPGYSRSPQVFTICTSWRASNPAMAVRYRRSVPTFPLRLLS
jgi:hypothetical protein